MTDTLTVIAILAAGIWLSLHSFKALLLAFSVKNRVPKDVSTMGILVPPQQSANARKLLELGLVELGQVQYEIPAQSAAETVWLFVTSDQSVLVQIIRSFVFFYTYFGSSRLESTLYPTGERIISEHFVTDFIESTVAEAYEAHLHRVREVPYRFGTPTKLSSMRDYIQMEILWRRKLGARMLRRRMILDIAVIGATIYSIGVVLLFAGFTNWLEYIGKGVFPRLRSLLVLLIPAVVLLTIRTVDYIKTARTIQAAG